jgi:hypothetical protein
MTGFSSYALVALTVLSLHPNHAFASVPIFISAPVSEPDKASADLSGDAGDGLCDVAPLLARASAKGTLRTGNRGERFHLPAASKDFVVPVKNPFFLPEP